MSALSSPFVPRALLCTGLGLAAACGGADKSDSSADSAAGSDGSSDGASEDTGLGGCEDLTTHAEQVVCATNNFLATLTESELAAAQFAFTDAETKTLWSNLPVEMVPRAGLQLGAMSTEAQAAAYTVARAALSDQGYSDLVGIIASDDYLQASGGGSGYGSSLYSIAVFGTPSTTGDWMVMIGGHHMAYMVTYRAGVGYPTPNHQAAEPKASFTLEGESYAPVESEGSAFTALFSSLTESQRAAAYLDGQVFADVLLGPDEYGTGSTSAVVFPSGSDRGALLASSLDAAQLSLLTAVINEWVGDFDPAVADELLATYTSTEALAETYVAFAGDASGPDVDAEGTYMRIDGPRVWIELACQGGVIVRGETHFHTIFRDKTADYGGAL
jgi:hypothetical protein